MHSLRIALRQLTKSPRFTALVVIVLALGVGATTAIFSVVHAVLLNPFPYKEGKNILFVGSTRLDQGQDGFMSVTYPDFLDWQQRTETAEVAYATGSAGTLLGSAEPVVVRNAAVSASLWPLLGLPPVLGRTFTPAEDRPGAEPVCVLSYASWQTRFSGDSAIINRTILIDDKSFTVVGVMPPAFKFWAGDVWTPAGLKADTDMMRSRVLRMDAWVVARPRPGQSLETVRTELNTIAAQIGLEHPDTNKNTGVFLRRLADNVTGPFQNPLMILLGAVACVLLIACANVANLLLARTASRQREYAVRAALGATRGQLVRQLFVETLPLALLGGIAGLLVGYWGLLGLLQILPAEFVPAEALGRIDVNGPVMLFSLAVTLGTLLLFSLFPALESSRTDVNSVLQEGSRGTAGSRTSRVRSALIVAEVALSLALLVGAGLLIRTLGRLGEVEVGFDRENLLVVPFQLSSTRYANSDQTTAFFRQVLERLPTVPDAKAVAATTNLPFTNGMGMPLLVEGRTYADLNQLEGVQFEAIIGDYFRAEGVRLLQGRTFTDADRRGSLPVIILNEAAVKRFLPDGEPLGKQVMLGVPENLATPGMLPPELMVSQWATVVGVVATTRHFGLFGNDETRTAYLPLEQSWNFMPLRSAMTFIVRTVGVPLNAVPHVRQAVASIDPGQPVGNITTMDMIIDTTLQGTRFQAVLLGIFAAVALALAVVGIYGVVAWNVMQRTREIGIRQALGANRADVLRLVVGQSMRVVGIGLITGVGLSLAVARLVSSEVFGISTFDPLTFALVIALLAGSALVACLLPARRATKVDPLVALRAD